MCFLKRSASIIVHTCVCWLYRDKQTDNGETENVCVPTGLLLLIQRRCRPHDWEKEVGDDLQLVQKIEVVALCYVCLYMCVVPLVRWQCARV